MWLCCDYRPTTLFSLKTSLATSSGGKSNLVPTMYAMKLALVSAALESGDDGRGVFEMVRRLPIRFRPPRRAVVSNTLVRVLREARSGEGVYGRTVGFREYCYYAGDLRVAFDLDGASAGTEGMLRRLLPRVSYLGKRGSFVQYAGCELVDALGPGFGYVTGDRMPGVPGAGVLQYLDDVGPGATFAAINTYDEAGARLGRDRVLVPVLLPYRQEGSSRGYTSYVRTA